MKCMDPLHASLADNLSDPYQTSKLLVKTVRHTNGIRWFFKTSLASVLKKIDKPNKSIFYFQSEALDWPQSRQKNPNFPFKHSY